MYRASVSPDTPRVHKTYFPAGQCRSTTLGANPGRLKSERRNKRKLQYPKTYANLPSRTTTSNIRYTIRFRCVGSPNITTTATHVAAAAAATKRFYPQTVAKAGALLSLRMSLKNQRARTKFVDISNAHITCPISRKSSLVLLNE